MITTRPHPMELNEKRHKARHEELHQAFDELIADYLRHHPRKLPSNTTMLELMTWSFEQTIQPTGGRG